MSKSNPGRRTQDTISRSVLADQVKEWLLAAILDGTYPPNARIIETQVAKELGTSQAPIREALRGLEALGMVDIVPFHGARVRQTGTDELLEAYLVRSALEVLGAQLAAKRMTDDDIEAIAAQGERMYRAADAGDAKAVAREDAALHELILTCSGNKTLVRVWRSLEPFFRTYITLVGPRSDPQWSAHLHDPILEAVRARDSDRLVQAIERHFDEVHTSLTERLAGALKDPETKPNPHAPR
jgi:DNA-binding GntR family transcriptional regulator